MKNTTTLNAYSTAPGVAIHVSSDEFCVIIEQGSDTIVIPFESVIELIAALASEAQENTTK